MELVHDVLRKGRKSDPIGWQTFAQRLKRIDLPMEMIGNVDRRRSIHRGCVLLTRYSKKIPRVRTVPRSTTYVRWQVEHSKSHRKLRRRRRCRLPSPRRLEVHLKFTMSDIEVVYCSIVVTAASAALCVTANCIVKELLAKNPTSC